jgi:hypothetical protein
MAGKSQLLPTDAWAASSVTEKRLEELVRDGFLWPKMNQTQPEWRAPPSDHREPAPPEGYVVSFVCFHERGFGMPASPFMRVLLHYYKVELHHLAPNVVSQAAIFGMEPQWNLWLHLFRAEFFCQEGGRVGGAARGARGELRAASLVRSKRSVHPGAADLLEQRLARRLVLPPQ